MAVLAEEEEGGEEEEEEKKAPSAAEKDEDNIGPAILLEDLELEEEIGKQARETTAEEEAAHQGDDDEEDNGVEKLLQNHYLESIDSTLVIRQLPSQGLSFQLWPAATILVSLLNHHNNSPLSTFLNRRSHLRILELGSGTGFVGIAAAAILGASVTVTDLPHVLPNLQFNSSLNASAVSLRGGSVNVAALRWGEDEDVKVLGVDFDVILGSDVVYHEHLFEPLLRTLCCLLKEGEKGVTFLMAHLRRWKKKESGFFKKARKLFRVEKIHSDPPLPGSRIGVVVYSFARKC